MPFASRATPQAGRDAKGELASGTPPTVAAADGRSGQGAEAPVQDHTYREGAEGAPVLMLSVAGRAERLACRPAAGAAKRHLDAILSRLHAARPDVFPDPDADAFTLMNAHPGIEYEGATGRTEAPVAEYVAGPNVARVRALVRGRPVIALGGRARRTCDAAGIVPVATGRHPSSLNRLRDSRIDAATPSERTSQRYDIAARQILDSVAV